MATVADIIRCMEEWAPAWTAESWDRVGLMVGDPAAGVERAWVALELGPELLQEALAAEVGMLLLHHPPLFQPLDSLRSDRPPTRRLIRAASSNLALYAAHTNLDLAPGGVNDALAGRLGLVDTRPLAPARPEGLAKLVTFVPAQDIERLAQALFQAGAGRIGEYRECFFTSSGTGGYLSPTGGRPYRGRPGQRSRVEEERLETVVPLARAQAVLAALYRVHPYQEPAVDLYPLKQAPADLGLGRVGRLARPCSGAEFVAWAARELGADTARVAGHLPETLERVAVVGGSGGDMVGAAAAAGAQVLVTGEARYHQAEEARDRGLALVTLGHYQTEVVVVEPWARRLGRDLARAGVDCEVKPWTGGGDPWRTVLAER